MKRSGIPLSLKVPLFAGIIAAEVLVLLGFLYELSRLWTFFDVFFKGLSLGVLFHIINHNAEASYKLIWIILILVLPFAGGIFYLLFGAKQVPQKLQVNQQDSIAKAMKAIICDQSILSWIEKRDSNAAYILNYIVANTGFIAYQNTECIYYSSGETMFEAMLQRLKLAQKSIYMEYFILEEGVMWAAILEILIQKVRENVEVKILLDGAGCYPTLPSGYDAFLREKGIQCILFNPLQLLLRIGMNNRDHRKMLIIDNTVAFTGGINLADEYINMKNRYGHWKDTGIELSGDGVWSFTLLFLQFWNYLSETPVEYLNFTNSTKLTSGIVLPFGDSPTDKEEAGFQVHLMMIQNARHQLWIQTPYLIIGEEMKNALCTAAKGGVDVRIFVPYVPDRWIVHMMTRGNYLDLIQCGVKIYEYLPGFLHSKVVLMDDELGLCGTINMDYRSYYLHYENAVLLYQCEALKQIKEDFLGLIDQSQLMTMDDCMKMPWFIKLFHAIVKLFSPLM